MELGSEKACEEGMRVRDTMPPFPGLPVSRNILVDKSSLGLNPIARALRSGPALSFRHRSPPRIPVLSRSDLFMNGTHDVDDAGRNGLSDELHFSDSESGDSPEVDAEADGVGDYSTRFDELMSDGEDEEADPDDDEDEGGGFVYAGVDSDPTGGYRDQLRDVLGADHEEDEVEAEEVERSLVHEVEENEKFAATIEDEAGVSSSIVCLAVHACLRCWWTHFSMCKCCPRSSHNLFCLLRLLCLLRLQAGCRVTLGMGRPLTPLSQDPIYTLRSPDCVQLRLSPLARRLLRARPPCTPISTSPCLLRRRISPLCRDPRPSRTSPPISRMVNPLALRLSHPERFCDGPSFDS